MDLLILCFFLFVKSTHFSLVHNLFTCDVYTVVLNDSLICHIHILLSNKYAMQMYVYSVHENILMFDNVFAMLFWTHVFIWTNDNIYVVKEAT